MTKPRIPLPKQTEQAFKDKTVYDRKDLPDPREECHEWSIDCPTCGTFTYVGPEPVICPQCQDTDIESSPIT